MKTLLVGASVPGVPSADWMQGALANLADFDLVIVNSLSLEHLMRATGGQKALTPEQFKHWAGRLTYIRERATKLLKSGGRLVAVMGAGVMRVTEVDPDRGLYPRLITSSDWLPLPVEFRSESGDTIKPIGDEFARYLDSVKVWRYYLEIDKRDRSRMDDLRDEHGGHHVEVRLEPAAVNRQNLPIAGIFYYEVHETRGDSWKALANKRSGPLVILPPPTETSVDEGLKILLEDIGGLKLTIAVPEWVARVPLDGANDLLGRIGRIESRLQRLGEGLASLRQEMDRRNNFRALLYGTGVELQQCADQAFREMGLETSPSDVSDEFTIRLGNRELLVEVKGNEGSAKLADLRQLLDYQLEHEQAKGIAIKGCLLVNAWRKIELSERGQERTPIFPANVVKRANDNGIALLDSRELFNALNQFWQGRLRGESVFQRVYSGVGVVSFSP